MARILVPIDESELSTQALERALETYPDDEIVVLHVVDPVQAVYRAEGGGPSAAEEWIERERDVADRLLAEAESVAGARDRDVRIETVVGKPGRKIVEYAEERDVDHVVMGSHGRKGLPRFLLGSVAETVIRNSPVDVTVVRG